MLSRWVVIAASILPTGVAAGAQYCNNDVPYYVEEIPHGYAIVHGAWADYCKRNIRTDSPDYICDGREDYRLRFKVEDGNLTISSVHGGDTRFYGCVFGYDSKPKH